MGPFRSLLALICVACSLLPVRAAFAQDVFGPGGLVELLPSTPVLGTADRQATLGLVALRPDGTPRRGMVLTAEANHGEVGPVEELRDGVYVWTYWPGTIESDLQVTMTVRQQLEDASEVLLTAPLMVRPHEPLTVDAGEGDTIPDTVQLSGVSQVVVRSSAGSVGTPTRSADGRIALPLSLDGESADNLTLTVVDAADPFGRFVTSAVGPAGRVEQKMWAAPGSEVTLTVGDRVYGPVKSDVDGRATIAVEVPKGVTTATQTTRSFDGETRIEIPLVVESQPVLTLFPLPSDLPASRGEVPLRAVLKGVEGASVVPVFEVEEGAVTEAQSLGAGIWEAVWTLPEEAVETTVRVGLPDGPVDEMQATVVAPTARSLTLTSEPSELTKPVLQPIELSGKIAGPGSLSVVVDGGVLTAEPLEGEDGTWRATVSPSGTDLEIQGYVKTAVSTGPVSAVALIPERSVIPAGQRVDLLVATLDAFGRPVPNAEVVLSAESGRMFPPSVITGADGVARAVFQPDGSLGLTAIRARAGAGHGATGVISARYGSALRLPSAGDARAAEAVSSWQATVRNVWMPGSAPAPVGPLMIISLDPPRVEAGSTVSLVARPLDEDGRPFAEPDVSFEASLGEIGPNTISADGVVTAPWTLPADAAGDVTVSARSGDLFDSVVVPFGGEPAQSPPEGEGEGDGVADAEGETEETSDKPKKPKKDKPPKEPRVRGDSDIPWLRARLVGVGSVYRYQQTPSDDPGPLLGDVFSVGGAAGGSPASPYGGELDARAWGDELGLAALGVHVSGRLTSYAIDAPAFGEVINDTLGQLELDVLGRLPLDLGGNRFWLGGRAGLHRADFITFESCTEADCDVNVQPLGASALGLGAEVGADVGRLYLLAGYSGKFAGLELPYANAFDAEVGVTLVRYLYLSGGLGVISRSADLVGVQSEARRGVVEDSQILFRLGAGFAL
ncbi:MAG: Ig-like domain-containing protein [Myxococcales bacterium]|nr:Ig-like domain-containing protein [Myxococcales bacterium]